MKIFRILFDLILRIAGPFIKREIDRRLRGQGNTGGFNLDSILNPDTQTQTNTQTTTSSTQKRIVTSEDGRLAATCPAGWVAETRNEYLGFGTSQIAVQEGIGNIPRGEAAVHFELLGRLSSDDSVNVAHFKQLIQENESTIYADATWGQPVKTTIGARNTASMIGTSEYGDQVLMLIAQPQGEHILMIFNTATGESDRFEAKYREIAGTVLYQG